MLTGFLFFWGVTLGMTKKKTPSRPKDTNQLAKSIMEMATAEKPKKVAKKDGKKS